MDNFVIYVLTIHIGIFSLINVKVALRIKFTLPDLKDVFVSKITTKTNLEIVSNVFLQCMLIKLQNYV